MMYMRLLKDDIEFICTSSVCRFLQASKEMTDLSKMATSVNYMKVGIFCLPVFGMFEVKELFYLESFQNICQLQIRTGRIQ